MEVLQRTRVKSKPAHEADSLVVYLLNSIKTLRARVVRHTVITTKVFYNLPS